MIPPVEFQDRSGFREDMKRALSMDPASTVVLTVDMQRDYLDLSIASSPLAAPDVERILPATARLLDTARAAAIPVVHAYVKRRMAEIERGFRRQRVRPSVYSTSFSAANRGYQVVLASDCTASMRGADQHWMALELMSRSIGWVLTVDEIVDRLGLSGPGARAELADVTTGGN
jgi:nicotinamidase-related amidase